ncbi:MAG: hypothetical protein MUF18_21955 [Fimbriiglobus sp.]|nr:hypothetical protein [Fimbriiglobus sp.]
MSRFHWLAAVVAVVAAVGLAAVAAEDKKANAKETPFTDDGHIKVWLLLAPIPLAEGESQGDAVDKEQVKDEAKLAPKDGEKVKVGKEELTWKKQVAEDYFFDLNKHCGEAKEQVAGYAVTYITSDAELTDVTLKLGSDDGFKVWLNGKELGKGPDGRIMEKDQNSYDKLTLKKGENVLVFKVCNGIFDWTGCARFVDKNDKPITKGLKVELKK